MTEIINSLQNKQIKLAASLQQKKYRDKEGLFLVEGIRLAEEAVKSSWEIKSAFFLPRQRENARFDELLAVISEKQCPVYQVTAEIFAKLSETQESQGIILIIKKRSFNIHDLVVKSSNPYYLALDNIQDPGNAGTIIRTAEAAGCDGILLNKGTVDIFSSKVVRAAMGAIFRMKLITGIETEDILKFAKEKQLKIMVTALDNTAKVCFAADFTAPVMVVLGNEGNGVEKCVLEQADEKVFIPMAGKAESLNVSIAAAVVIYEGIRQRSYQR